MSKKVTVESIEKALNTLVVPKSILKEVKNRKKEFDDALKIYKRKRILSIKFKEKESYTKHKEELQSTIEKTFSEILQGLSNWEDATPGYTKARKLQSLVVAEIEKSKKKHIIKSTDTSVPIKPESNEKSKYSLNYEDYESSFNKLKKLIKEYESSASIFKRSFSKDTTYLQKFKDAISEPIKYILHTNIYYSEIKNSEKIDEIMVKIQSEIDSVNKKIKDSTQHIMLPDTKTLVVTDKLEIYFDTKGSTYKKDYEAFLKKYINQYTNLHDATHDKKSKFNNAIRTTKSTTLEFPIFKEAAKKSHEYLKSLREVMQLSEEFIEKNPKYKASLGSQYKKLSSGTHYAALATFENKIKSTTYAAKFGTQAGATLRNLDKLLDDYASLIKNLILKSSISRTPIDQLIKSFDLVKEASESQAIAKIITVLSDLDSSVITTHSSEEMNNYAQKLSKSSTKVTREIDHCQELYDNFKSAIASYEKANSALAKTLKAAKVALAILAVVKGTSSVNTAISSTLEIINS